MSIIRVGPDNVEVTTLLLQPSQSFTSSSAGLTGSIRLVDRPSTAVKNAVRDRTLTFSETESLTDEDDLYDVSQKYISASQAGTSANVESDLQTYLRNVNSRIASSRQNITFYPKRYVCRGTNGLAPSASLDVLDKASSDQWVDFQRKIIKDCLIPDQIVENPLSKFSYGNYHSLNFISSSAANTGSALIYPNFADASGIKPYSPDEGFSIDFFIKPKGQIVSNEPYHPGTILHISSSICLSLLSGSSIGPDGRVEKYRLLLQLSQSADTSPKNINLAATPTSPNDLVFATADDLTRDTWHHVTVRWSGSRRSSGDGFILVDDKKTRFRVASSSIACLGAGSDALILGNYYDSGQKVGGFFNATLASVNGTDTDPAGHPIPTNFTFPCPLNAEIHHLSLFKRYIADEEVANIANVASQELEGPVFHLPLFFTGSVTSYNSYYTPTSVSVKNTQSPFSFEMALGYNSYFLNLQNFILERTRKKLPYAYGYHNPQPLSPTTYDLRTTDTDFYIMGQAANRKRNFLIVPCDNGNFIPNFDQITDTSQFYYDDLGNRDTTSININTVAPVGFRLTLSYAFDKTDINFSYNGTGNNTILPYLQNLNAYSLDAGYAISTSPDFSSNLVTIFSIPSVFYGTRIVPGTFTISDTNISGSGGQTFTLSDDMMGNLYRSNTRSTPAKWNRVGAIFYNHGLVAILTPHLPFFGKNMFTMTFRGESRKSVASYTVKAEPSQINLSRNPTYKTFPPTQLASESADDFVYITGINLHDENLNVLMRAKLAQPVKKRAYDEIAFRLRYDF